MGVGYQRQKKGVGMETKVVDYLGKMLEVRQGVV